MWQTPQIPDILYYIVYYNKSSDIGMMNFSSNAINGIIEGLVPNSTYYQFTISVTIEVSVGVRQEGPQTHLIAPGIYSIHSMYINCFTYKDISSNCCMTRK